MVITCPICDSPVDHQERDPAGSDALLVDCPRCGNFAVAHSLAASLPHLRSSFDESAPRLSHALRRAQEGSPRPLFTTQVAEAVLKQPLPRPREQADLLVRWLAEHVPGPGETVWIEYATHGAIIGSKSQAGFELVLDHVFEAGLVTGDQSKTLESRDGADATLSFAGWDQYEDMRRGSRVYRRAFMAMKFGDDELERLLERVLKPSALRAGFQLVKLTDVPKHIAALDDGAA